MTGGRCFVDGCDTRKSKGEKCPSLYRAPTKDLIVFERWRSLLNKFGRKGKLFNENSQVCAKHFEESDIIRSRTSVDPEGNETELYPIKNSRIRLGAIPKLNLGNTFQNFQIESFFSYSCF